MFGELQGTGGLRGYKSRGRGIAGIGCYHIPPGGLRGDVRCGTHRIDNQSIVS